MGGRGSSSGSGGGSSGGKSAKTAGLLTRLKGGATLRMKNPETGMSFNVHAKSFGGVTGYKITKAIGQDGKSVSGTKGHQIMSTSEASSWLGSLKESK